MAPRTPQLAVLRDVRPAKAASAIFAASVAILGLLLLIIYGHGRPDSAPPWVSALPLLNAVLNAASATFVVMAYAAVRRRAYAAHARHILKAVAASGLFLVSYILYPSIHGDTRFPGHGAVRPLYFFI